MYFAICFFFLISSVLLLFLFFSVLLTPHPHLAPRSPHSDPAFSEQPNVYKILHLLKGCRLSMGTHWGIVTETLLGNDEEIALETCQLIDGKKWL